MVKHSYAADGILRKMSVFINLFFIFRCDVCVGHCPEQLNYQEEAKAFLQVLTAQCVSVVIVIFSFYLDDFYFWIN